MLIPSYLEAAFNAAAEAMIDLNLPRSISLTYNPMFPEQPVAVMIEKPDQQFSYVTGRAATAAQAFMAASIELEKVIAEGCKLQTAGQAVEAVKALIAANYPELLRDNSELVAEIDALPVAK